MTDNDTHTAWLFSQGADARLRGDPELAGRRQYSGRELEWWLMGYYEVHARYGAAVKGRWPVRELPPVREESVA